VDSTNLLRAFGVRIVELDGLGGTSGWMPSARVLVLDSSLTGEELEDITDQVLAEVLSSV
jgi:hypothetical protein